MRASSIVDRLVRAWQELRFRDALLLTCLPLLALAFVLGGAVRDYLRARVYDDWWSRSQSVAGLYSARVHAIASLPKSLRLRDSFSPDARDAAIIRFDVPAERWDSLEVEPDGVWAPWLDGALHYGGTTLPIRLRKRGDNSVHWLTEKRSLSVRTPRDDFYKQYRSFALSSKDVLTSYLANRLGQEFDLLVPGTEVSPVFVNNRFFGTYRFIEVVDESFLRPLDRMPGNIFRGDAAERGEYYKGMQRNLFTNVRIWDRASANDRWTSAGTGQLRLLLEDVAGTTFADHQRLMNRLDRGEYARLFAYLLLMGDPYHIDGVHNQLHYEDPSTQKLHPIPWDTRLRPLADAEQPLNALFKAVLTDPFVIDSTMRAIAQHIEGDRLVHTTDSLAKHALQRYGRYLEYDKLRTGLVPDVGDSATALRTLRGNIALLREWLASDTVAVASTPSGGFTILDFETRGRVGADLTAIVPDRAIPGAFSLRLDANSNGVIDDSDPLVALRADGNRWLPAVPVSLLAGWSTTTPALEAGHVPYRVFVIGVPAGVRLDVELRNRATGVAAHRSALEAGTTLNAATAWHPWRFPTPTYRLHRLSGSVRIASTLRIPRGDTLVIDAGTTLRLARDISIVSEGRVLAHGTAASPIRVLPDSAGVPWGTFALLGHGADSSSFSNMEFAQGSSALIDRVEYTGMVNVHRAIGVRFDSVTFRENLRSDDALHALHANIHVLRSHFVRANSDAFDLDISTGEITDNTFDNSGNDGLDLMSSTPVISGNRITGSGDKGISIGESSRPFVFNNIIDRCNIGIETKDRSEPIVLNNIITRSNTGLRERRKNWRYGGGGWPIMAETVFEDNATPWKRDVFSRVTLQGVTGLDTVTTEPPIERADIVWLYRLTGVTPPPDPAPGVLGAWIATAPVAPIDQQRFIDDFGEVADGWSATGGVDRLEKRRDALVIEAERRPGTARRDVTWNLPTGGTLVVELSARDLTGARIVVVGTARTVTRPITPAEDMATSRFFTVALPAGTYRALALELQPVSGLMRPDGKTGLSVPRSARIDLRGYRLLPTLDPAPPPTGLR